MKHLLILALLMPQMAYAQSYTSDLNLPELSTLKQEGQLLSIRIRLGEPLRIFVVGREEAKLDLSDLKLTVKRLEPYPVHTLL